MCCFYNNCFRNGFNMNGYNGGFNGGYIYVSGRLNYEVVPRYYNRCGFMQCNFNYPVPYMMSDYFMTGNGYGFRTGNARCGSAEPNC